MTDEVSNQDSLIAEAQEQALVKSYEFANCPITVNLQIFPEDTDGRRILIGIRNHQDAPIFRSVRSQDFNCIQQLFDDLLAALKEELPSRLSAAIERERQDAEAVEEVDSESYDTAKTKKKQSKSQPVLPTVEVKTTKSVEPAEVEQMKLNLFG